MRIGWEDKGPIPKHARSDDFNTFIEQVVERLPGHFGNDVEHYIGPPSSPIDFIGRHEALADDLVRALRQAGEPFDEAALRAYPPDNVGWYDRFPTGAYRPDLAERLAASEHAVIERFYADDPVPARLLSAGACTPRAPR
jgi:hypothetical protein